MKKFINTVLSESRTPARKFAIVLLVISLFASALVTHIIAKKPRPVYKIPVKHQSVFSWDDLKSDVTVLDSNQVEIDQNIFLLNVPIWNAGNTASSQVDEFVGDVNLQFEEQARILRLRVPLEHNKNISNFKLSLTAQPINQPPSVKVEWKKLLPDEGGVVQIVYVAPSQVKVKMVGTRNDGGHFYSAYSRFTIKNYPWYVVLLSVVLAMLVSSFVLMALVIVPLVMKFNDWIARQEQKEQRSILYKYRYLLFAVALFLFMWSTRPLVNFILGSYDPPALLL